MPAVVHFDIASDDPQRAKKFYESLFGWKMMGPPGMTDYYLFDTQDLEGKKSAGGGLGKRGDPSQKITVYFGVDDIDKYIPQIVNLGGKIIMPKTPVPGWGFLANCIDTEGNPFGIWQEDSQASA
jgi:uncharacterized protein